MANVLLVGPYSTGGRSGQYPAPPLGAHRLASHLRAKGHPTRVVDPVLDDLGQILAGSPCDVIGWSILHDSLEKSLKASEIAKRIQPGAIQIAGGQGASFLAEELLKTDTIDIVALGPGEQAMEQLSRTLSTTGIPGTVCKSDSGPKRTPRSPWTPDFFRKVSLNTDFSSIPYERYWESAGSFYSGPYLDVSRNRGFVRTIRLFTSSHCPMRCSFCSSWRFSQDSVTKGQPVLRLEPDEILELIKKAVTAHPGVEALYFIDDDFMQDGPRVAELCRLMALPVPLNLMCMGRVDRENADLLEDMSRSGFRIVFYGVETFSDRMAVAIGKTRSTGYGERAMRAIRETVSCGITPQISLMLFIPDSSEEDLLSTISGAVEAASLGGILLAFPYVEAYAGTSIGQGHTILKEPFTAAGHEFVHPRLVLPASSALRRLAHEAIGKTDVLDMESWGPPPVPPTIHSLNLFRALYEVLGKPTGQIELTLQRIFRKN